jgi:hypothetical protein
MGPNATTGKKPPDCRCPAHFVGAGRKRTSEKCAVLFRSPRRSRMGLLISTGVLEDGIERKATHMATPRKQLISTT